MVIINNKSLYIIFIHHGSAHCLSLIHICWSSFLSLLFSSILSIIILSISCRLLFSARDGFSGCSICSSRTSISPVCVGISGCSFGCAGGFGSLGSVSYTHLDVYKRQLSSNSAPEISYFGIRQSNLTHLFFTLTTASNHLHII